MFGIGYKRAEATIVERRVKSQKSVAQDGAYAAQTFRNFEYIAEVRPEDGSPPFRAVLKDPFNQVTFKQPNVGQTVRVKYRHTGGDGHKVKFDRADDGTYQRLRGVPDWRRHADPRKAADEAAVQAGHTAQAEAEWEAALHAPSGSSASSAGPSDRELAAREAELQELLDQEDVQRRQGG